MADKKVVVKVGGSFQSSPPVLKRVCETLDRLSDENCFIVVPGGGQFADLVREFQSEYDLSGRSAHKMAVLAIDIFGYLLDDLLPGFSTVSDLRKAGDGYCVFPPFEAVKNSGLGESWEVTSDSISAWVCGKVDFDELTLIKRVDGIYDREEFRERISTGELRQMDQSVVDKKLPDVLERFKLNCTIVNGEYPERIERSFEGDYSECTRILPEV